MTTNTEGLKPCPFCIGEMSSSGLRHTQDCYFTEEALGASKARTLAAWNRRPTAQASEAIRNAALEELCSAIMTQVVGNIRTTVRDCVNGFPEDVQDIYEYCDAIESLIDSALSTMPVEPVTRFCPDCGQRNNGDLVHTCSPQVSDAIRPAVQDAPLAITAQIAIHHVTVEGIARALSLRNGGDNSDNWRGNELLASDICELIATAETVELDDASYCISCGWARDQPAGMLCAECAIKTELPSPYGWEYQDGTFIKGERAPDGRNGWKAIYASPTQSVKDE